ncbi:MAG TPA: VWA domain-containing protein [Blastocatellia bacterium]|nr:VWA domain-containing protein [Blastocatellia bacterium]
MKSRLVLAAIVLTALAVPCISRQSGRSTEFRKTTLNLIINFPGNANSADQEVTKEDLALFDGGVEQSIDNVTADHSAAHVVLLVDNTASLKLEVNAIGPLAHKVLSELYGDDEAMVIAYAESAEVLQPFTKDANKLRDATKRFKKEGMPRLFDAISATLDDALLKEIGSGKRVIVLISDGYDRDSQVKFEDVLAKLQDDNIVVYAIQVSDRTLGVSRRSGPKPVEAIQQLTEGTGGKAYSVQDIDKASKEISEEMRHGWYQLSYSPAGVNSMKQRRLLVTAFENKFKVRTKSMIP